MAFAFLGSFGRYIQRCTHAVCYIPPVDAFDPGFHYDVPSDERTPPPKNSSSDSEGSADEAGRSQVSSPSPEKPESLPGANSDETERSKSPAPSSNSLADVSNDSMQHKSIFGASNQEMYNSQVRDLCSSCATKVHKDMESRAKEGPEEINLAVFETMQNIQARLADMEISEGRRNNLRPFDYEEESPETAAFFIVQELVSRVVALTRSNQGEGSKFSRGEGRSRTEDLKEAQWGAIEEDWRKAIHGIDLPQIQPSTSKDFSVFNSLGPIEFKGVSHSGSAIPRRGRWNRAKGPTSRMIVKTEKLPDNTVGYAVSVDVKESKVPQFKPSSRNWKFFSDFPEKVFQFQESTPPRDESGPSSVQTKRTLDEDESQACFKLKDLPIVVLTRVFNHMSFVERESTRRVSRTFYEANRMSWGWHKTFRLRHDLMFLFPEIVPKHFAFCSLYPIRIPIQKLLRVISRSLTSVDLSSPVVEKCSEEWGGTLFLDEQMIMDVFGSEPFAKVEELNLRNCHFTGDLLPALARVFPNVDHIRISVDKFRLLKSQKLIPFKGRFISNTQPDFYDIIEQCLWNRFRNYREAKLRLSLDLKHCLFLFASAFPKLEIVDFNRESVPGHKKTRQQRLEERRRAHEQRQD